MVPPPSQNTVGVCNQITLLVSYYISSTLVPLLKVINTPVQVPVFFFPTVSFKFINFSFKIFLLFVPELSPSLKSYLHFFQLCTLLCDGSCNHSNTACFISSKIREHSSTNHVLYCFNSYRPRHSLPEVFVLSLMFSQALFMFCLLFKFS